MTPGLSSRGVALMSAVTDLGPRIAALRGEIERDRRLPDPIVNALRDAGLLELWLPRSFDGPELPPPEFVRVIEELSKADASVGWCATIAAVYNLLAGSLRDDVVEEVFGNHRVVAGSINPTGKAMAVAGGYRVTGRWSYGSGIDHSTWILANCVVHDGAEPRRISGGAPEMRFALFPKAAAEVIDTWHVSGLRGTGSHDFRVADLLVPAERTTPAFISVPVRPGTLYAMPLISLFCLSLAAVATGIARAAIESLVELANVKTSMGSSALLRDKPSAQADIGRAESLLRSSRAFLLEAIQELWDEIQAGEAPSMHCRAVVRFACTHTGEACSHAVDLMYKAGGASSLYEDGRLERCFRDIHAATQHIGLSPLSYELGGRVMLGLDPGTIRF